MKQSCKCSHYTQFEGPLWAKTRPTKSLEDSAPTRFAGKKAKQFQQFQKQCLHEKFSIKQATGFLKYSIHSSWLSCSVCQKKCLIPTFSGIPWSIVIDVLSGLHNFPVIRDDWDVTMHMGICKLAKKSHFSYVSYYPNMKSHLRCNKLNFTS